MTASKNAKTDKKCGNMLGCKEKSNTSSQTNSTTQSDKSNDIGKRMKAKKLPRHGQIIQTRQNISKQRKTNFPASMGGGMHEGAPIIETQGIKQFERKIWKRKEHISETELIKNKEKESGGLLDSPMQKFANIYSKLHTKKYQIGKQLAIMAYMDSGFEKFASVYDRLALKMKKCLEETHTCMDVQRKDHSDPKGPHPEWKHPHQI